MKYLTLSFISIFIFFSVIVLLEKVSLTQSSQTWGIVISADESLKEALDELKKPKVKTYKPNLYICKSWYRGVILFPERKIALANLKKIKKEIREDSYLVDMSTWCVDRKEIKGNKITIR